MGLMRVLISFLSSSTSNGVVSGSITLGFEPMASSSLIHFLDFRIVDCYFVDLNFDIIFVL